MLKFEAHVMFEVPDGTNADELAEILDYVKAAVEQWRYHAGKDAPWKMASIDVPSFQPAPPSTSLRAAAESLPAELVAKKKIRVLVQKWEESERGWGTRPDGYSIHPDEAALERYLEAYYATLPKEVPDEYERKCGMPYWAEVEVEGDIGDGKRVYKHVDGGYPGDGGKDGWVVVKSKVAR
jgi:hypothetical protein